MKPLLEKPSDSHCPLPFCCTRMVSLVPSKSEKDIQELVAQSLNDNISTQPNDINK